MSTDGGSRIRITRRGWKRLTRELHQRGGAKKESGAFLLASVRKRDDKITRIAFYDDLDPDCLTGGIEFSKSGFARLWDVCRAEGLTVRADVHTHPGDFVSQSRVDEAHPMIATPGHVAMILPRYSADTPSVLDGSVNVFLGRDQWKQVDREDVRRVVDVCRTLWRTR